MNLLLFEWKLFFRNKRLKQQLILMLIMFPLIMLQVVASPVLHESFWIKEFLFIGLLSLFAQFAAYSLNTNASFFEKQMTMPVSVLKILQTKYYFFCITTAIALILLFPSIFFGIKFFTFFSSFLFVIGFMLFGLFYCSSFSYKPFDTKATAFYNYQGLDKGNYFFPLLIMTLAFGVILLSYWLFNETVAWILKSVIGIVFIATHRIWLKFIAQKIEEKKYYRIERFRGK